MQQKKPLSALQPKLYSKGLRQHLLDLHRDLFAIHKQVSSVNVYYPGALTSLEKMVVVLEDRRFFGHIGVDVFSAFRELFRLAIGRKHGGASTIDMQLVRTITGYRQHTIRRKVYECILAIIIQRRYSKIKILRAYLGCAFFGSHLIGSKKISEKLFGKAPDKLTDEEACSIAAMLVYPRPQKPSDAWELRVKRRATYGYAIYILHKDRFDELPI